LPYSSLPKPQATRYSPSSVFPPHFPSRQPSPPSYLFLPTLPGLHDNVRLASLPPPPITLQCTFCQAVLHRGTFCGVTLAERSRSSFALYLFVCMFLLLSLSAMPMMTVRGNSKILRTGFRNRAHHWHRAAEGGLHL
jgi:hypothetical protein